MQHARATIANLRPRRCANWAPHVLSQVERSRFIMTVAAWHNARLSFTSPALVMPPETSRSPDFLREGVNPTQGPTLFADRKRAGSSIAARKVSATTARIPGIVIRRLHTGSSPRKLAHALLETGQFLSQACPDPQHRCCRGFQHEVVFRQFPDPGFKPTARDRANFQTKAPEQSSERHFQSDHVLLNRFSSTEHSAHLLRRE